MTKNDACPKCNQSAVFGYRNKDTGEMAWYCTEHRLGQFWADARRGPQKSIMSEDWEGWQTRRT
jgi:hypothetical protein